MAPEELTVDNNPFCGNALVEETEWFLREGEEGEEGLEQRWYQGYHPEEIKLPLLPLLWPKTSARHYYCEMVHQEKHPTKIIQYVQTLKKIREGLSFILPKETSENLKKACEAHDRKVALFQAKGKIISEKNKDIGEKGSVKQFTNFFRSFVIPYRKTEQILQKRRAELSRSLKEANKRPGGESKVLSDGEFAMFIELHKQFLEVCDRELEHAKKMGLRVDPPDEHVRMILTPLFKISNIVTSILLNEAQKRFYNFLNGKTSNEQKCKKCVIDVRVVEVAPDNKELKHGTAYFYKQGNKWHLKLLPTAGLGVIDEELRAKHNERISGLNISNNNANNNAIKERDKNTLIDIATDCYNRQESSVQGYDILELFILEYGKDVCRNVVQCKNPQKIRLIAEKKLEELKERLKKKPTMQLFKEIQRLKLFLADLGYSERIEDISKLIEESCNDTEHSKLFLEACVSLTENPKSSPDESINIKEGDIEQLDPSQKRNSDIEICDEVPENTIDERIRIEKSKLITRKNWWYRWFRKGAISQHLRSKKEIKRLNGFVKKGSLANQLRKELCKDNSATLDNELKKARETLITKKNWWHRWFRKGAISHHKKSKRYIKYLEGLVRIQKLHNGAWILPDKFDYDKYRTGYLRSINEEKKEEIIVREESNKHKTKEHEKKSESKNLLLDVEFLDFLWSQIDLKSEECKKITKKSEKAALEKEILILHDAINAINTKQTGTKLKHDMKKNISSLEYVVDCPVMKSLHREFVKDSDLEANSVLLHLLVTYEIDSRFGSQFDKITKKYDEKQTPPDKLFVQKSRVQKLSFLRSECHRKSRIWKKFKKEIANWKVCYELAKEGVIGDNKLARSAKQFVYLLEHEDQSGGLTFKNEFEYNVSPLRIITKLEEIFETQTGKVEKFDSIYRYADRLITVLNKNLQENNKFDKAFLQRISGMAGVNEKDRIKNTIDALRLLKSVASLASTGNGGFELCGKVNDKRAHLQKLFQYQYSDVNSNLYNELMKEATKLYTKTTGKITAYCDLTQEDLDKNKFIYDFIESNNTSRRKFEQEAEKSKCVIKNMLMHFQDKDSILAEWNVDTSESRSGTGTVKVFTENGPEQEVIDKCVKEVLALQGTEKGQTMIQELQIAVKVYLDKLRKLNEDECKRPDYVGLLVFYLGTFEQILQLATLLIRNYLYCKRYKKISSYNGNHWKHEFFDKSWHHIKDIVVKEIEVFMGKQKDEAYDEKLLKFLCRNNREDSLTTVINEEIRKRFKEILKERNVTERTRNENAQGFIDFINDLKFANKNALQYPATDIEARKLIQLLQAEKPSTPAGYRILGELSKLTKNDEIKQMLCKAYHQYGISLIEKTIDVRKEKETVLVYDEFRSLLDVYKLDFQYKDCQKEVEKLEKIFQNNPWNKMHDYYISHIFCNVKSDYKEIYNKLLHSSRMHKLKGLLQSDDADKGEIKDFVDSLNKATVKCNFSYKGAPEDFGRFIAIIDKIKWSKNNDVLLSAFVKNTCSKDYQDKLNRALHQVRIRKIKHLVRAKDAKRANRDVQRFIEVCKEFKIKFNFSYGSLFALHDIGQLNESFSFSGDCKYRFPADELLVFLVKNAEQKECKEHLKQFLHQFRLKAIKILLEKERLDGCKKFIEHCTEFGINLDFDYRGCDKELKIVEEITKKYLDSQDDFNWQTADYLFVSMVKNAKSEEAKNCLKRQLHLLRLKQIDILLREESLDECKKFIKHCTESGINLDFDYRGCDEELKIVEEITKKYLDSQDDFNWQTADYLFVSMVKNAKSEEAKNCLKKQLHLLRLKQIYILMNKSPKGCKEFIKHCTESGVNLDFDYSGSDEELKRVEEITKKYLDSQDGFNRQSADYLFASMVKNAKSAEAKSSLNKCLHKFRVAELIASKDKNLSEYDESPTPLDFAYKECYEEVKKLYDHFFVQEKWSSFAEITFEGIIRRLNKTKTVEKQMLLKCLHSLRVKRINSLLEDMPERNKFRDRLKMHPISLNNDQRILMKFVRDTENAIRKENWMDGSKMVPFDFAYKCSTNINGREQEIQSLLDQYKNVDWCKMSDFILAKIIKNINITDPVRSEAGKVRLIECLHRLRLKEVRRIISNPGRFTRQRTRWLLNIFNKSGVRFNFVYRKKLLCEQDILGLFKDLEHGSLQCCIILVEILTGIKDLKETKIQNFLKQFLHKQLVEVIKDYLSKRYNKKDDEDFRRELKRLNTQGMQKERGMQRGRLDFNYGNYDDKCKIADVQSLANIFNEIEWNKPNIEFAHCILEMFVKNTDSDITRDQHDILNKALHRLDIKRVKRFLHLKLVKQENQIYTLHQLRTTTKPRKDHRERGIYVYRNNKKEVCVLVVHVRNKVYEYLNLSQICGKTKDRKLKSFIKGLSKVDESKFVDKVLAYCDYSAYGRALALGKTLSQINQKPFSYEDNSQEEVEQLVKVFEKQPWSRSAYLLLVEFVRMTNKAKCDNDNLKAALHRRVIDGISMLLQNKLTYEHAEHAKEFWNFTNRVHDIYKVSLDFNYRGHISDIKKIEELCEKTDWSKGTDYLISVLVNNKMGSMKPDVRDKLINALHIIRVKRFMYLMKQEALTIKDVERFFDECKNSGIEFNFAYNFADKDSTSGLDKLIEKLEPLLDLQNVQYVWSKARDLALAKLVKNTSASNREKLKNVLSNLRIKKFVEINTLVNKSEKIQAETTKNEFIHHCRAQDYPERNINEDIIKDFYDAHINKTEWSRIMEGLLEEFLPYDEISVNGVKQRKYHDIVAGYHLKGLLEGLPVQLGVNNFSVQRRFSAEDIERYLGIKRLNNNSAALIEDVKYYFGNTDSVTDTMQRVIAKFTSKIKSIEGMKKNSVQKNHERHVLKSYLDQRMFHVITLFANKDIVGGTSLGNYNEHINQWFVEFGKRKDMPSDDKEYGESIRQIQQLRYYRQLIAAKYPLCEQLRKSYGILTANVETEDDTPRDTNSLSSKKEELIRLREQVGSENIPFVSYPLQQLMQCKTTGKVTKVGKETLDTKSLVNHFLTQLDNAIRLPYYAPKLPTTFKSINIDPAQPSLVRIVQNGKESQKDKLKGILNELCCMGVITEKEEKSLNSNLDAILKKDSQDNIFQIMLNQLVPVLQDDINRICADSLCKLSRKLVDTHNVCNKDAIMLALSNKEIKLEDFIKIFYDEKNAHVAWLLQMIKTCKISWKTLGNNFISALKKVILNSKATDNLNEIIRNKFSREILDKLCNKNRCAAYWDDTIITLLAREACKEDEHKCIRKKLKEINEGKLFGGFDQQEDVSDKHCKLQLLGEKYEAVTNKYKKFIDVLYNIKTTNMFCVFSRNDINILASSFLDRKKKQNLVKALEFAIRSSKDDYQKRVLEHIKNIFYTDVYVADQLKNLYQQVGYYAKQQGKALILRITQQSYDVSKDQRVLELISRVDNVYKAELRDEYDRNQIIFWRWFVTLSQAAIQQPLQVGILLARFKATGTYYMGLNRRCLQPLIANQMEEQDVVKGGKLTPIGKVCLELSNDAELISLREDVAILESKASTYKEHISEISILYQNIQKKLSNLSGEVVKKYEVVKRYKDYFEVLLAQKQKLYENILRKIGPRVDSLYLDFKTQLLAISLIVKKDDFKITNETLDDCLCRFKVEDIEFLMQNLSDKQRESLAHFLEQTRTQLDNKSSTQKLQDGDRYVAGIINQQIKVLQYLHKTLVGGIEYRQNAFVALCNESKPFFVRQQLKDCLYELTKPINNRTFNYKLDVVGKNVTIKRIAKIFKESGIYPKEHVDLLQLLFWEYLAEEKWKPCTPDYESDKEFLRRFHSAALYQEVNRDYLKDVIDTLILGMCPVQKNTGLNMRQQLLLEMSIDKDLIYLRNQLALFEKTGDEKKRKEISSRIIARLKKSKNNEKVKRFWNYFGNPSNAIMTESERIKKRRDEEKIIQRRNDQMTSAMVSNPMDFQGVTDGFKKVGKFTSSFLGSCKNFVAKWKRKKSGGVENTKTGDNAKCNVYQQQQRPTNVKPETRKRCNDSSRKKKLIVQYGGKKYGTTGKISRKIVREQPPNTNKKSHNTNVITSGDYTQIDPNSIQKKISKSDGGQPPLLYSSQTPPQLKKKQQLEKKERSRSLKMNFVYDNSTYGNGNNCDF